MFIQDAIQALWSGLSGPLQTLHMLQMTIHNRDSTLSYSPCKLLPVPTRSHTKEPLKECLCSQYQKNSVMRASAQSLHLQSTQAHWLLLGHFWKMKVITVNVVMSAKMAHTKLFSQREPEEMMMYGVRQHQGDQQRTGSIQAWKGEGRKQSP